MRKPTYVYVDGFNLYYRAVKNTPYKWLNIAELCKRLLKRSDLLVKYFTARVNARPDDPDQPIRQQTFLRALATLPNVEVIFGHFHTDKCWMAKVEGYEAGKIEKVHVVRTKEKGSDVNLATHLLRDAYERRFETAALLTNDSDLLEPLRIVRRDLGLKVGLLSPTPYPSVVLAEHAAFIKRVRPGVLASSQFPEEMTDATGVFCKPESW